MTANQLYLQLIDGFQARVSGTGLAASDLPITSAPARLALGYLALSPGKTESRAKLAAMIWEDSDDYRARRNLRQLLYGLRADLGRSWDGLKAGRSDVTLQSDVILTDCDEIIEALQIGTVPDVIVNKPEIHRRLLTAVPDQGELFASWLHLRRKEFENQLQSELEKILNTNAHEQREQAARALLSLDASDENAARRLISLYHDRGDTGRALGVYSSLWEHLDEAYGMEPAPQTQDLIVEVKSGVRKPLDRTPAGSQGPAEGRTNSRNASDHRGSDRRIAGRRATDRNSGDGASEDAASDAKSDRKLEIGVLPILTSEMTGDAHLIGDLFRTELISRMVSFREIDVIDAAVKDVATEYRLKLTMAPAGEQLALIATLTRSTDGMVIWSDRFGQIVQHWWEYQADLASRLATACSLTLSRARLSEIRTMSTVQGSINNWLMGQKFLDGFHSEDWDSAISCFRKAIELDPSFSMAYSSLSQVHNIRHLVHPGFMRQRELLLESKSLANAAIALDPTDSRAHLCRAWSSLLLADYAQSAASFAIARQCNENDPWTVMSSALGAAFSGEIILANELASRFHKEGWTSNLWLWGYQSNIHFLAGDDEACVIAIDYAGDCIMNLPAWKAAALWHLGKREEAAAAWRVFETAASAQWTGTEPASTETILAWFLACFPIRMRDAQERLAEGATQAAQLYLHCPQT
ncbi:BTAD domain-containing putative transcriptional regulator [Pelagibius sp. Alg239-R121]|uniref:BTAD domain-containing putative transcriptional regulator n=1 Tax=Pelagibius sp. Alg239-R121 TaxID=2993448 RepID=UPI0024A6E031|nr:BTAD domain-containing putative transcriptional regulator [Pelagibius sp. Alg239-R121]